MAQIRGKKLHIKTTGEFCGEFWKLFYLKEEQMAYLGESFTWRIRGNYATD